MKLMKRANIYQASNYNATFDPAKIVAVSYKWWTFVKIIKGEVVFNAYRYSVSTSKHQNKVRSLMRELKIKIDREVSIRDSLGGIDSLKELNLKVKAQAVSDAQDAERKRIQRNEKARLRRIKMKLENYLENQVSFRDYEIELKARFGRIEKIAVHQQVDASTLEADVQNAIYNFQRDGFGSIIFYV